MSLFLFLYSLSVFGSEDLLQCISKGKTMETCRVQTRMHRRLSRASEQKKIEDEERTKKLKEVTRNWETYFDPVKNTIVDKASGQPVDLRNYSLIDREIIICQIRGGTWNGKSCSGNILAVAEESKKVKTTGYIDDAYKKLKKDPKMWAQVSSQLEQKEQMRLELKNARILYRKLLKYGMNAISHEGYYYVLENSGELVPVDNYAQMIAYQEALNQGKTPEQAEQISLAPPAQEVVAPEPPVVNVPTNDVTQVTATTTPEVTTDPKTEKLNALIIQLQLTEEEIQEVYTVIESGQYTIDQTILMLEQSTAPATK